MLVTLEMFDNAQLSADDVRIRKMMRDRAEPISRIPGLKSKVWFNNPALGRFGAVLLWNSRDALDQFRLGEDTASIAERWGVMPIIEDFEVYQSVVDGRAVTLA